MIEASSRNSSSEQFERETTNAGEDLKENLNIQRFTELGDKWIKVLRLLTGFVVLLILRMACADASILPLIKVPCLQDLFFVWTESVNQFFQDYSNIKKALLIIFGFMMDFTVLVQFYKWSIYGKSWRFPIAIVFLYALRFLFITMFQARYPEGYIWEFPGIYSVTVHYSMDNSFFFAVHIGLCSINATEFIANKNYRLAAFTIVTMICQALMLIFLRGHYSIDIFASAFFGHYFWMQAERVSKYVDFNCLGIPFHKRFPHFIKKCANCDYPINQWVNSAAISKDFISKDQDEQEFAYSQ